MPGLVVLRRRWNIGSDDLILPSSLYLLLHLIWILIYGVVAWRNRNLFLDPGCSPPLTLHAFGQLVLIIGFVILECCIIKVSLRGSILKTRPRASLNFLLYIWFALLAIEIIWEAYGLFLLLRPNRQRLIGDAADCPPATKDILYGLKIYLVVIWATVLLLIWSAYDSAGRSWVKMKRFQESLNNPNSKYKYRRSNSFHRNWRHREAVRKYEKSWIKRCRMFCCIEMDRNDNAFTDIAKLLSEFFRDIDVVPSDVIAGLSLMRVQQKAIRMERLAAASTTPEVADPGRIFQFLSGVPITSETKFVDLTHMTVMKEICNLIHYLHYSLAIYGWPMYMMANQPSKWCRLLNHVKCCANHHRHRRRQQHLPEAISVFPEPDSVPGDNCCLCHRAAIRETCIGHHYKIIYLTYYVSMEKPPFFVAVDYEKCSIVISIRGTLSVYDVLTDLNADYDLLPVVPPRENWFGHKGMVAAATYISTALFERRLIHAANEELNRANGLTGSGSARQYPIIVVGHSLGAGTASILTVLLRQSYSNVICFAFAPPGGLLSEDLAEYTKDFIISVVLGKDIVPRLGLHQMEKLRFDLINSIKHCQMSKWGIIVKSCCLGRRNLSMAEFVEKFKMAKTWPPAATTALPDGTKIDNDDIDHQDPINIITVDQQRCRKQNIAIHPNDENISLTVHTPLYPPGSIIHLVKIRPNKSERIIGKKQFIIQALWAGTKDFNEILISPGMIRDHMPDKILAALHSLLINTGPPKPQRSISPPSLPSDRKSSSGSSSIEMPLPPETSFGRNLPIPVPELNHEERLKRLRSLISKRRAPLAVPEMIAEEEDDDDEYGQEEDNQQQPTFKIRTAEETFINDSKNQQQEEDSFS